MGIKKKGVGPIGLTGSIHHMEGQRETYSVSKVAVIAYVSALHNTLVAQLGSGKKINVFSCTPGSVATDFNNNRGTKTVEEGADTPVWLALHSPEEGTGKFWDERKVVDF
jgi:carbonyl reductase 1